jgi:hypothetical protein
LQPRNSRLAANPRAETSTTAIGSGRSAQKAAIPARSFHRFTTTAYAMLRGVGLRFVEVVTLPHGS